METRELCKNSEGDPAKPGIAATTCWQADNQVLLHYFLLGSSCSFRNFSSAELA
jgi:hypothetical protein